MTQPTNPLGLFLEALPLEQIQQFAGRADRSGFESAWFPEITFADAFIPAAAAAQQTQRLQLATGVVGIWSRSPAAMALSAATLHQLCGERLILGLGLQARTYVENWHGRRYERPVQAMREYVTIIRSILSGKNTTFEGDIFSIKNFQMHIPPPQRPIPIYVAAIGPKMLELAGEVADGLLGYFYSVPYLEEFVLPRVRAGARRAGRDPSEIHISCGLPSLISSDERAFDLHRGQILMFATASGSSPFYAESFARAGYADALQEIQERVAALDIEGALASITPEMVDTFTLTGAPGHVHDRIAEYQAAGVQSVLANPSPPGAFFPLYQGHFPEGVHFPELSIPDFLATFEELFLAFHS